MFNYSNILETGDHVSTGLKLAERDSTTSTILSLLVSGLKLTPVRFFLAWWNPIFTEMIFIKLQIDTEMIFTEVISNEVSSS